MTFSSRRARVREHHRRLRSGEITEVREHERGIATPPAPAVAGSRLEREARDLADRLLKDHDANVDHNEWDPTMTIDANANWWDLHGEKLDEAIEEYAQALIDDPDEHDPHVGILALEHVKDALRGRLTYWDRKTGVPMMANPHARQIHTYPDDSPHPIYVDPNALRRYGPQLLRKTSPEAEEARRRIQASLESDL